jgi:opacity protein-like surface antigen
LELIDDAAAEEVAAAAPGDGTQRRMRRDAESLPECTVVNKSYKNQVIAATISIIVASVSLPALGAELSPPVRTAGFYGGVSIRDPGTETPGVQAKASPSAWAWYTPSTVDEGTTQALVFGGYRWRNDVAVEASFSSIDKYSLRPAEPGPARRGVGLGLGSSTLGLADVASRSWNLDVYTSWAFYKSFALYGRLGYAQAEATPTLAGSNFVAGADARRTRDGVNYGLGLRYNLKSDLGLKLEYARFAHFGMETGSVLPESDQVSVGVQFRF